MKKGFRVLDSDLHIIEPGDLYERYLEEPYRDRLPEYLGVRPSGSTAWRVQGQIIPPWADSEAVVGPQAYLHAKLTPEHRAARDRGYPPDTHLAAMDVEGIDLAVLFRTKGQQVVSLDDLEGDYVAALCRAFNNWLADYVRTDPNRLRGAAVLTLHDPELAAAEARRTVEELGFVGVVLLPMPVNGRNLNAPECDVLWAELQRLNIPVTFHPTSAGAAREYVGRRFLNHPNYRTASHASAFPLELMLALGSLTVGGVLHRFPHLRVALLEGGCGWLPWWLHRLDDQWQKYGGGESIRLDALPSEYFRRQVYIATEVDEELLGFVIDEIGDENIVVSTDYPHEDSAYPHAVDTFLALDGVTDESKRRILWDNCARLYGIEVPVGV